MGDVGDAMKSFKERGKLKAKEREISNSEIISEWCLKNGCHLNVIAPHHLRVMQDALTIDIFPQSKKYHNITKNERGKINGKITDFLTNLL